MAKKREGLVLSHTPKPAGTPLWLAVLVVGVCSVSDGLTIYLFSAQLFNETPAVSILISAVMACGLDVSLAVLGNILSAGRPDNKEARFRRKMAVIGLLTAFGLSFLALVLLAAAVSARNETDLLTDGTVARLIGPLVTSIVSFFITFCMDPVAQRRACLDRQIAETRNAIEDLDVETNRLEQAWASLTATAWIISWRKPPASRSRSFRRQPPRRSMKSWPNALTTARHPGGSCS